MTPEDFRKIIIPEGRRLYAFAFRYLNIREEAEDIVQEVMTKMWEDRLTLDRYENACALATTMTRNMCIDRLRKKRFILFNDGHDHEVSGIAGPDRENDFENEEASDLARRLISALKEPYKSAIILRDIEGYSYEEAAEVMKTNVNALRTILSRARKNIRDEIEKVYSYGTGTGKGTAQKVL